MNRICENCRFWVHDPGWEDEKPHGFCHRWPPVWVHRETGTRGQYDDYMNTFPLVVCSAWCGEFRSRPIKGRREK